MMSKLAPQRRGEHALALRGSERVTALLLAMGKPWADRIIKRFEDGEIRAVARSAHDLPPLSFETIELLVEELDKELNTAKPLAGSVDEAKELLSGVVSDDEVDEIMGELTGEAPKSIWSRLNGVADAKLSAFLAKEEPQVAAFVIANLGIEKASAVIDCLQPEQRAEISRRMLSLPAPNDLAIRLLAERVKEELLGEETSDAGPGNHARLGAILNQLERPSIEAILRPLEESHPAEAEKVRQHVFSFEDIAGLRQEDRGRLFDEVQSDRLVLALRGTDAALQLAVVSALSPRARRIVEAELAQEQKPPAKAVAEARRAIANLALSMAAKSEIVLRPAAEQPAT